MRTFIAEFNVYRWAGRMLVDASRLRSRDRLTGRLTDHLRRRSPRPDAGRPFAARSEVLEQFAWSNVLLAFDFDGTLAPIVREPARAALAAAPGPCSRKPRRLYPTVVISGRARRDAAGRLHGIPVAEIIGNHGIEPWRGDERVVRTVRAGSSGFAARSRMSGSRDRGQAVLDRGPLPPLAPEEGDAGGDPRRRVGSRRIAAGRRQAGRQHRARRALPTRASRLRPNASGSAATPRSTSATTRRTRTSSRSTSRAGSWRFASAGGEARRRRTTSRRRERSTSCSGA